MIRRDSKKQEPGRGKGQGMFQEERQKWDGSKATQWPLSPVLEQDGEAEEVKVEKTDGRRLSFI